MVLVAKGVRVLMPFFVGQNIMGAEVVGVWEKFGAMLDLPGPKKWTKNWLKTGTHLSVGDRVDVRVKSVDAPNRRVIVAPLEAGAQQPRGQREDRRGSAFEYQ